MLSVRIGGLKKEIFMILVLKGSETKRSKRSASKPDFHANDVKGCCVTSRSYGLGGRLVPVRTGKPERVPGNSSQRKM